MEILVALVVGLTVGSLTAAWQRCPNGPAGGVAIGVLGALFGAAAGAWLDGPTGRTLVDAAAAAVIGSGILLLLWVVAQRLFVCPPANSIPRQ